MRLITNIENIYSYLLSIYINHAYSNNNYNRAYICSLQMYIYK